ncbi:hypothetical protein [Garicola koreensis]|uniref:Ketohydroxyglutarate aldolase n=1 Tax=Garicola koreensis TaxID=1262554 RepID=A0A7W5XZR5_9MICC|nr:hypothetical protein [Garicola koreensis]MBB3666473.1 hypothetical protein [Garicola koreensis]
MARQQWIVTVRDDHRDQIDTVIGELEAAGLQVEQVLGILGQITGRAGTVGSDEGTVHSRLSAVAGVESVDSAQQYSVGPPDAEIQ